MKLLLVLLLFPLFSQAKICEVKIDGNLIGQYHSEVCDKSVYGGPWGSSGAIHNENITKTQAYSNKNTVRVNAHTARKSKRDAIKLQCASASGLLKDLCEYL